VSEASTRRAGVCDTRSVLVVVGVSGLAVVAGVSLSLAAGSGLAGVSNFGSILAFPAVGLIIVRRYPTHAIGWALIAVGFLRATGELGNLVGLDAPLRLVRFAAWYGEWYWVPMVLLTFVLIPLLFPTGRLPSPRWRPLWWVVVLAGGQAVVAAWFQQRLTVFTGDGLQATMPTISNPIGWAPWAEMEEAWPGWVLFAVVIPSALLAAGSLVDPLPASRDDRASAAEMGSSRSRWARRGLLRPGCARRAARCPTARGRSSHW
jgi:hypothetical protein